MKLIFTQKHKIRAFFSIAYIINEQNKALRIEDIIENSNKISDFNKSKAEDETTRITDDILQFVNNFNLNLINDTFISPQICKLNDKNIAKMYFIINNKNSSINSEDTIIINLKELKQVEI